MFATFKSTNSIATRGLRVVARDPTIIAYPLLSFLVLLLSVPSLNLLLIGSIASFLSIPVLEDNLTVSSSLIYLVAITTSLMIVSALLLLMSCVVSAATRAELEGSKAPLLDGWKHINGRILRIIKTGLVCVFFILIPLAIFAQRKKLRKHPFAVIASSVTLGVGGLAPAILSTKIGVRATIRNSINTLSKNWKEGILVKVYLYGFVITLSLLSFLPALVEKYWFDDATASTASWLTAILIFGLIITTLKIFSTIVLTVQYYEAKNEPWSG